MSTDATQVTGSAASEAPRPGAVLAERYELLELVDAEGLAFSYRALDQESERPVLVRVLAGDPFTRADADRIVERLRAQVGVGGRYLGSLLDADHERGTPFTVEAWPNGTQLSAILAARRARAEALGPRETLPVVAQLAAALAALPGDACHGEVRAENVWLDTDGLRLTGAHFVGSLGTRALRARVGELGPGALAYAPELAEGAASATSDAWGVASIAWEALTGRSADPDADAPELPPPVREELIALLSKLPASRPAELGKLVAALASAAGLAVPRLDPEPSRARPEARGEGPKQTRAIEGAAEGGTQQIAFEDLEPASDEESSAGASKPRSESVDSLDPRLVRAALGISMDSEDSSDEAISNPDDTARHDAVSVEDLELAASGAPLKKEPDSLDPRLARAARANAETGLDPRLVRAALEPAIQTRDEPRREPSIDGLDPRLVRAALGVTLEDSLESQIEEIDSDLISADAPSPSEPEPPKRAVPSRPPSARSSAKLAAAPRAPAPPGATLRSPEPRKPAAPSATRPSKSVPRAPAPPGARPRPSGGSAPPRTASAAPVAPPPAKTAPPAATPSVAAAPPRPSPASPEPPPTSAAPSPAPAPSSPAPIAAAPIAPAPSSPMSPAPMPPAAMSPASMSPAPMSPAPMPPASMVPASMAPAPMPPASMPPASPSPAPMSPAPASPARPLGPTPTSSGSPRQRASSSNAKSVAGIAIVLVALIVAALIVGVGFLIASHRRAEAVRQRELEQRWQEIQLQNQ
ncbi:MAG: hypothetical protein AB7P00_30990 [Sandaracinaceae bacterium]